MTIPIRVGILGCANIARKYAIRAFQAIEGVEVSWIASRNAKKAFEWSEEFGIPAHGSYDELIASSIDAVYIPLPIGLHKEWAVKAAQRGKHILCEKSLAPDFHDVKEIVEECRSAKVLLYENFMCDHHPQHAGVLEKLDGGEIGPVRMFRGFFGFPRMNADNFRYDPELGGGALNDAGAYTVFMARKMLRDEPVSASSHLRAEDGVDMHGSALLEMRGGISALIGFSFDSVYQNNYMIWGQKGSVSVDRAYSIPPQMEPDVTLVTNDGSSNRSHRLEIPAANHFELAFAAFFKAVRTASGSERENMYAASLLQARAMQAIRISARESRRVMLSEIV